MALGMAQEWHWEWHWEWHQEGPGEGTQAVAATSLGGICVSCSLCKERSQQGQTRETTDGSGRGIYSIPEGFHSVLREYKDRVGFAVQVQPSHWTSTLKPGLKLQLWSIPGRDPSTYLTSSSGFFPGFRPGCWDRVGSAGEIQSQGRLWKEGEFWADPCGLFP